MAEQELFVFIKLQFSSFCIMNEYHESSVNENFDVNWFVCPSVLNKSYDTNIFVVFFFITLTFAYIQNRFYLKTKTTGIPFWLKY